MRPPADPCSTAWPGDNLVLVEKRAYGVTAHDANQPVTVRSYRDKPADLYSSCVGVNNEDSIGWLTETRCD